LALGYMDHMLQSGHQLMTASMVHTPQSSDTREWLQLQLQSTLQYKTHPVDDSESSTLRVCPIAYRYLTPGSECNRSIPAEEEGNHAERDEAPEEWHRHYDQRCDVLIGEDAQGVAVQVEFETRF
jgi:hypothetical protein